MLHAAGTRLRAAALLLLACCANAGTLFLIKVHAPTEAMLARVCEAARQSREAAFPSTFVLLDFTEPTGSSLLPPVSSWCEEEVSVTRLTLALMAELWGKKHAETFLEHGYHFASLPELTYHAKYGRKGGHKHVWVFEQDVAWTGNVFDFFPSYAILPQDFLCDKLRRMEMPAEQWAKQDGDGPDWKPPRNWAFPWWDSHSGWAHATPHRTVCGVYVTRYSARLMDALVDNYLSQGSWAHCEAFAATVCELQLAGPGFEGRNCSVGNLRADSLFRNPQLMFSNNFRVGMPGNNKVNEASIKRNGLDRDDYLKSKKKSVEGITPPKLFHPVKY